MILFYWLVLLLLFLFKVPSFAQQPHYKFKQLGNAEGLSQSTVMSVFQDSKGFLWYGTRDGLNKYDGYKFIVYKNDEKNKHSIGNNFIKKITEDRNGDLWIATEGGGLNFFDRDNEKFVSYKNDKSNPNSISSNFINDVYCDNIGRIWVATDRDGLNVFDPKNNKFTHFISDGKAGSLSSNVTKVLLIDKAKNVWIGTDNGLNLYDSKNNSFKHFIHDGSNSKSLSNNYVWDLYEDSSERLWIGTYGGGLNLLDKKTGEFKCYRKGISANSIAHDYIIAISEDDDGNLWLGTENHGISILNPEKETFQNIKHDDADKFSLTSNSINDIIRGRKGNIWIGTFSGGVNYIDADQNKFGHFRHLPSFNQSLSNNKVTSFVEDKDNNLWIGTDGGGLNLFDKATNSFSHFKHNPQSKNCISGDFILDVFIDSEEDMWIGTWGDGLTKFNKKTKKFTQFKNGTKKGGGILSNNIWCILEDSKKNLWIGTYGIGLNLFDREANKFIPYKGNSLNINTIFEDNKGRVWVGYNAGGLSFIDIRTRELVEFKLKSGKSLGNKSVICIHEDKAGNLWVGTREDLNVISFDKGTITTYSISEGLPNNAILGIMEDAENNLWFSTNRGISKFNPNTNKFKNYTPSDGLQGYEFKEGAYCKTKNGLMYFGGINGFNEFDPLKIKDKPYDAPLVFTNFEIFNQPVEISSAETAILKKHISEAKDITLSYRHSVVSFEFATLDYTDPIKKQYAYKLDGFDKSWNFIGTKHSLTYTNLDPGKYNLQVKSISDQGEATKNYASIGITILPPFWKTLWFQLLTVTTTVVLIILIIEARGRGIRRQKRKLEEEVKLRTTEIREVNSKLELLYKDVKDSIKSARFLQKAILPSNQVIKSYFPESFILNLPKDEVSGDFYWFDKIEDELIVALIDCSGHGVSGAFMSIHGHHLLNQAVNQCQGNLQTSEILDRLDINVINNLQKNGDQEEYMVGMDIALLILNKEKNTLQYSGALNPLYIVRENKILETKADKYPIGFKRFRGVKSYTNHTINVEKGDIIYLFSDGYADQLGGENSGKFLYYRFREFLTSISSNNMERQSELLKENLNAWKGKFDQLDDILIIGIKI